MLEHAERRAAGVNPAAFRRLLWQWSVATSATVFVSIVLAALSSRFGYDREVIEMPSLLLAGVLVAAGAAFAIGMPWLIAHTHRATTRQQLILLAMVIAAGLVARIVLFPSEPMLEDDYHRYLWDGAVTAKGHNPYAVSPLSAIESGRDGPLGALAAEAGPVLPRINHKSLTTIYPPIAQGAFALAHLIEPWSVAAWRGVLVAFDVATLGLLILLLDATGRSRLWSALYWLNPVVLKEVFNSGHMEAVVLPFVLLSILLARRRPLLATVALGLAAGAKFWPALLAPLVWRQLWGDWRKLAAAGMIFAGLAVLWLVPMATNGMNESTGLVAYLDRWQTNSALFPSLVSVLSLSQGWLGFNEVDAGGIARALIALLLAALAIAAAWRRIEGPDDLIARSSMLVAALVLFSPAQFPWYTVWMAPFLVFRPYRAFLVLTALIPLYYTLFYFVAHETAEVFNTYVVWAIWVPVWGALVWDMVLGSSLNPVRAHT